MIVRMNFSDCAKALRVLNNYTSMYNIRFYVIVTDNHLHLNCISDGTVIEDVMRRYHCAFEDFIGDIIAFKNAIIKIEADEYCKHINNNRFRYKKLWSLLRKKDYSKSSSLL